MELGKAFGMTRCTCRRATALAALAVVAASCGDLQRQDRAASYVMIDKLEAASGVSPTEFGSVLQSDVVTNVKVNNVPVPTIFEDIGQVSMHLVLKDPGSPTSPNTAVPQNYITIDRYHVEYKRSDGRNTPGVDVPYPFDGAFTVTVPGAGASASFTLVRGQAKLEAPLFAMRGVGGAWFISTIAEITFYGHDQTGTPVSAKATISVNFSDWGDPAS